MELKKIVIKAEKAIYGGTSRRIWVGLLKPTNMVSLSTFGLPASDSGEKRVYYTSKLTTHFSWRLRDGETADSLLFDTAVDKISDWVHDGYIITEVTRL